MVYREGPSSNSGLILGATAGMGDVAIARFRFSWMIGGHYQRTFPGRDNGVVSFMIASGRTNSRLIRYKRERDSVLPGSVDIQAHESAADYPRRLFHSLEGLRRWADF